MKSQFATLLLAAIVISGPAVGAGNDNPLNANLLPTEPLAEVLDAVSGKSGETFALDMRVQPTVVLGQLTLKDLTYDQLTLVLRNNGLAAVRINDVVNIMPVNTIRQAALPLLVSADTTVGDEEWVTRVFRLENANPKMMVPILRPMLPQQGHLVAHPESGTLVMVDRYANTERIAKLVKMLDVPAAQQE